MLNILSESLKRSSFRDWHSLKTALFRDLGHSDLIIAHIEKLADKTGKNPQS